jgi:hypothetical protein
MQEEITNFAEEAKINCTLCIHPHIVKTYGIWFTQGAGNDMIVMGTLPLGIFFEIGKDQARTEIKLLVLVFLH